MITHFYVKKGDLFVGTIWIQIDVVLGLVFCLIIELREPEFDLLG